jgi:soluble lytic murein transglycosylase-like protein
MAVNPAASTTYQVTGAIRQAAQSTGISFEYLLTTAKIESNFNPSAQASTSSAKGLYQFIDQTWLGTMKQDGAALGLGRYADAITRSPDGRYQDPAMVLLTAGAVTRS